jgi:hypothetical protein
MRHNEVPPFHLNWHMNMNPNAMVELRFHPASPTKTADLWIHSRSLERLYIQSNRHSEEHSTPTNQIQ